ncbi:MAG: hypothetical protein ABEK01_02040 [Candidatus Nanohaloarchaea archaeon]
MDTGRKLEEDELERELEEIGLPVEESRFYLVEEVPGEEDALGNYRPGMRKGFVKDGKRGEVRSRYLHEAAHAGYFENIETGKEIAEIDREVVEMEEELFGGLLDGETTVVTSEEADESRELDPGEAEELLEDEPGSPCYIVPGELFEEYSRKRGFLEELTDAVRPVVEGLSLYLQDRVLDERPGEVPRSQMREYRRIKQAAEKHGFGTAKRYVEDRSREMISEELSGIGDGPRTGSIFT